MTVHRRALPLLATALLAVAPLGATVQSRTYEFEANRWMTVDQVVDGVRVQSVRFDFPASVAGIRAGNVARVVVVSDVDVKVRVGVGIALYDGEGTLVGAGTEGNRVFALKPGKRKEFDLRFNHLTERIEQAATFQLALEVQ